MSFLTTPFPPPIPLTDITRNYRNGYVNWFGTIAQKSDTDKQNDSPSR